MGTAQRRGHGIRGIARVPPAMSAVSDSVKHLERDSHTQENARGRVDRLPAPWVSGQCWLLH
eukprot:985799-Alexandrium_andersonii.AAC.1